MEINIEHQKSLAKGFFWAFLMSFIFVSLIAAGQTEMQKLEIFVMYFLVLWLLGYLMLEKAWSIGKPRIASIGMLAMLVTPIIGYFLVNRFGLTGYIITVLGTGLAMKLYQIYV